MIEESAQAFSLWKKTLLQRPVNSWADLFVVKGRHNSRPHKIAKKSTSPFRTGSTSSSLVRADTP